MKRIFTLFLSLIFVFSLAACKEVEHEQSSLNNQQSNSQSTDPIPQDAPPPIVFTRDNFPRLDGSTSTVPLGKAIASVLLGESREEVSDLIHFSRTTQSFRALMWGESDLLIVAEPSPTVFDELAEQNVKVTTEPFATAGTILPFASIPTAAELYGRNRFSHN